MKNRNGAGKASGNSQGGPERLKLGLHVSQNAALSGNALHALSLYPGKACYLHTKYMELLICLPQPCGSTPGPRDMKTQKISPGFLNAPAPTTTFFFIDPLVISVHTTFKATPTFPKLSCDEHPRVSSTIPSSCKCYHRGYSVTIHSTANDSCGQRSPRRPPAGVTSCGPAVPSCLPSDGSMAQRACLCRRPLPPPVPGSNFCRADRDRR